MALDLAPQLRWIAPAAPRGSADQATEHSLRRWLPIGLLALVALCAAGGIVWSDLVAGASLVPIVVAAGLFLAGMAMYTVFAAAGLALLVISIHTDTPPMTLAAVAVVMMLMIAVERRRHRMGISGEASASMMVELRDQVAEHGRIPHNLPQGWHVDSIIKAAHGEAFAGDFLVTSAEREGLLELVLVDVEGCGQRCGTRSLMMSGAFSGLLGSTAQEDFLPAANSYLMRQGWPGGRATALHLALDMQTGAYSLGSAGHPAAMHFHAGAGRWDARHDATGVMLGVVDSDLVTYERATGTLERGDALLLYTDGIIESPTCDLSQGMDRILGVADRVLTAAPHAGEAAQICQVALAGESDDRSVIVIRRDL
ncbi:PP2C family protein-serine/threonine phosphatase [Demetria terragena]|uniref:PP2C family protein-serine/threonine phosphatase n=1 Tax=Demetria terragena TaxID=63959 RepID=UPI0012E9E8C9|nr:PP2C family protein-serine/threonine phosphatase [Demetria terragena]